MEFFNHWEAFDIPSIKSLIQRELKTDPIGKVFGVLLSNHLSDKIKVQILFQEKIEGIKITDDKIDIFNVKLIKINKIKLSTIIYILRRLREY